jgi:hypothetical protein
VRVVILFWLDPVLNSSGVTVEKAARDYWKSSGDGISLRYTVKRALRVACLESA